jgi:hypothetical protein
MSCAPVDSWRAAVESCTNGVWESVQLEAQNQPTTWLHQHDRARYQRWDELARPVAERDAGGLLMPRAGSSERER